MKMHIKWIDAEQNWDPSSQIMFQTFFDIFHDTPSCDEPDPFCGDCLLKSEAATRRLIKASGGVKVSSMC